LGHTFRLAALWGRGACWSSVMRLGRVTSNQSLTQTWINRITSWLMHSWNTFGVRTNYGQIRIHKTHHDPYSIPCAWPLDQHPNGILSRIPKVGTFATLGAYNLCVDLRLKWGLDQSCSFRQELFNSILHAICTQGY
jgi:hypothetical protein